MRVPLLQGSLDFNTSSGAKSISVLKGTTGTSTQFERRPSAYLEANGFEEEADAAAVFLQTQKQSSSQTAEKVAKARKDAGVRLQGQRPWEFLPR